MLLFLWMQAPCGKRDFLWKDSPLILLGDAVTAVPLRLVRQQSLAHSACFKQEINEAREFANALLDLSTDEAGKWTTVI